MAKDTHHAAAADCDGDANWEEPDARYAPPRAVCMGVHRGLLLAPILGLGCRLGRHCVPMMEVAGGFPRLQDHAGGTVEKEQPLFTWKALNSIFVTIFKQSPDSTAIYVHPSDMHYSAAPLGCLGPGCPTGTALLAQVVLDRHQEDHWSLCMLVFDAIQIGGDDFVQMQLSPSERYKRLMHLCCCTPNAIVSPIMRLQWAGEYESLRSFCLDPSSEANLSHITDNFIQYTREHPCKIVAVN